MMIFHEYSWVSVNWYELSIRTSEGTTDLFMTAGDIVMKVKHKIPYISLIVFIAIEYAYIFVSFKSI